MNFIFSFLGFIFISTAAFAKSPADALQNEISLDLYLPSLQFRYEDNADQSRSFKKGYSLNLAAELYQVYLIGLEYNTQSENSGNSSLSIARDFSEINIVAGYSVIESLLTEKNKFNFFCTGYLGQNKNKIKTNILGASSTDVSAAEFSYGLGALVQLKLNVILIELDTRMMVSKSYEPQLVSVTDLRLGLQIPL